MTNHTIPLSMAAPDKAYTISRISTDYNVSSVLKGYGIFPGSTIKHVFSSPSKDPSAYEVMGTIIALRRDLVEKIFIFPVK